MFADDITFHFLGHTPLGGAYNGLTEVLGYFGRLQQSGAAFKFEVHALLADDEHAVARLAGTAERLRKADRAEGCPRLSRQRRWQGHRLVELLGGPGSLDDLFA